MGLVRGNSDLLSRYNLATNGSFLINQRGTFTDYMTFNASDTPAALAAKVGSVISDGWCIHGDTNVDSLYAVNYSTLSDYSNIQLKGFGKKGQGILIISKDSSPILIPSTGTYFLTASASIYLHPKSVPVMASAIPRYYSLTDSIVHANDSIIKPGLKDRPVTILAKNACNSNTPAQVYIRLQADGFFYFTIHSYQELPGAFVNPPDFAPVHYAEDLARCKRYYQKGDAQLYALCRATPSTYRLRFTIPLTVEMAGTPTVTVSAYVAEEGSDTDVSGSYTLASFPDSKKIVVSAEKAIGGSKPSVFNATWTAVV